MPSSSKKSYGPDVQARVRGLLQALLEGVAGERALERLELKWAWSEDGKKLTIETTLRSLVQLSQPKLLANTPEFEKAKAQSREALIDLRDFVKILDDHRTQKRGSEKWHFSLRLWGQDTVRNLEEFDKLWESKRSPAAKPKPVPETQSRSPLKPGAPFPRVRLPENYVERPDALSAVKKLLLVASEQTLVVSAIAGLGGLGKSVLAAALVLDQEVQTRFPDGILWVTLGQSPDLQTMLGEWIRELDKSREAFSGNTLESASRYLDSLLAERQMLLVVDDVWNAAHSDWFRVGGVGCRILVTTREAQIEGAEYYPLDLMSEEEAIALVQKKIGRRWKAEQEAEVKAFAKVLGYLPLALDLATNQVRDGLSWAELRSEFEAERRAVALEVLDASEAWELLNEEQQRKYSLRASFNLSLRRLQPDQLRRFAWLGVLPEDTNLEAQVAAVLWDLPLLQTKKGLIDLRRRSFLTEGVAMIEGEPTYRIHDLMHDMARSLIAEGTLKPEIQLSSDTTQNLPLAHRQFLQRYRERAIDHRWNKLPNDGYIHRHLTWHMEQADWTEEVHTLMAMSDDQGRNAWFEVCDRIGQPAIFVEDVARGWRIADQGYEQDQTWAIVLNCRYALITATLNSLEEQLPAGLMAEFMKRGYWTPEQTWAYVEQMQDEKKVAEAIQAVAPYLPEAVFRLAVKKARSMQAGYNKALALTTLTQVDYKFFQETLAEARALRDEYCRAFVLRTLAQTVNIDSVSFDELQKTVKTIQNKDWQKLALSSLTQAKNTGSVVSAIALKKSLLNQYDLRHQSQIDNADFIHQLLKAQSIPTQYGRARALSILAQSDSANFVQLLEAARAIQDQEGHVWALSTLAQIDLDYFTEALEAARAIEDERTKAEVLRDLAKLDAAYFTEALKAARAIEDERTKAEVLRDLAKLDAAEFPQRLKAVRAIKDKRIKAEALRDLAKLDAAEFPQRLKAVRAIKDKRIKAEALRDLAKLDAAYFTEALEAARAIEDERTKAEVLRDLAKLDAAYFTEALEAARAIEDERTKAEALRDLAKLDAAYFTEALEAARAIEDERTKAEALRDLAKLDAVYFTEALEAARAIEDERTKAEALRDLAKLDAAYFTEALEAARAIEDERTKAEALRDLAKLDAVYFTEALEAAQAIKDERTKAEALRDLAQYAPQAMLPQIWRGIAALTHKPIRAKTLSDSLAYFPLATLLYSNWRTYLHLLAQRQRKELMQDLVKLYPAILHLGGEAAIRGFVNTMREVCSQWK